MSSGLWASVARASGLVTWMLALASTVWGLALSTRPVARRLRAVWLADLHRFLGALAVSFLSIHIGSSMLARHWSLVAAIVVFGDRPTVARTLGILGAYMLVAVHITSLARAHVPLRIWRRVHRAAYGVLVLSTGHALMAGTDTRGGTMAWVLVVATLGVTALVAVRVAAGRIGGRPAAALLSSPPS